MLRCWILVSLPHPRFAGELPHDLLQATAEGRTASAVRATEAGSVFFPNRSPRRLLRSNGTPAFGLDQFTFYFNALPILDNWDWEADAHFGRCVHREYCVAHGARS
jgi:hypothetical protein